MKRFGACVTLSCALGLSLVVSLLWLLHIPRDVAQAQPGASVIRVATTGSDAPGCGGAANPCRTVQYAVDRAASGDEIRVAAGRYTDVHVRMRNDTLTTGIVTQVVYISQTVTVHGGYAPTNWGIADPTSNQSILDAQGAGRVFYITGNISPMIEGFHITGGSSCEDSRCEVCGLDGLDVCCESLGAGIYVYAAHATISNNQVFGNGSRECFIYGTYIGISGGGVCLDNSDSLLEGNTIVSNTAAQGGGIALLFSPATVARNTILGNGLITEDGTYSTGGGIAVVASVAALTENTIRLNTAHTGGGLSLYSSPAILSRNTVVSNTAIGYYGGGGIYVETSDATFDGNSIILNASALNCGGMNVDLSDIVLNGNFIRVNTAGSNGGGLCLCNSIATLTNNFITGNRTGSNGSGLYVCNASVQLLHNTLARNRGGDGSGIYVASGMVALTNTILVSHSVGIANTAGNTVTLEATLWGKGIWANMQDWGGSGTIITGAIDIWDDPGFLRPDGGDYHITRGSAAVNRGIDAGVTTDIDGQIRPQEGGFDIGADEWPAWSVYLPLVIWKP